MAGRERKPPMGKAHNLWPLAIVAVLNPIRFHSTLAEMKSKQSYLLGVRRLLAAALFGTLVFSATVIAQTNSARPDSRNSFPVLPLEQSASRGIVTRDPSSIVKCNDEYWVFYT